MTKTVVCAFPIHMPNEILCDVSGSDRVHFSLESPTYHRLRFDDLNRFSGWVFWFGDRTIRRIGVLRDGSEAGVFPVDLPRPDIAQFVPHVPGAANCGFSFDLLVPPTAKTFSLSIEYDDGTEEPFVDYDSASAWQTRSELQRMARVVDAIPAPEPGLVFLTQGTTDVQKYKESAIPGVMNLFRYLKSADADPRAIRSLLDVGCGSGRLLAGWWALDPTRELHGCDVNARLIEWAKDNLPKEITFDHNGLQPSLRYSDGKFDLLYLISVFTHLSLASQHLWVEEFRRVVRPGGLLIVTLHGETYVRHSDDEGRLQVFYRQGYLENASPHEGSNEFATFHTREFAQDLFHGFELCAFFPNGRMDGRRIPFQIALLQDVYVFRRSIDAGKGERCLARPCNPDGER